MHCNLEPARHLDALQGPEKRFRTSRCAFQDVWQRIQTVSIRSRTGLDALQDLEEDILARSISSWRMDTASRRPEAHRGLDALIRTLDALTRTLDALQDSCRPDREIRRKFSQSGSDLDQAMGGG
jgi:hypothetical protein